MREPQDAGAVETAKGLAGLPARLWATAPGLLLAATIALASRFVSDRYGGPVMLYALLIGIAFNFLAAAPRVAPGVRAASRFVLQAGVAMLGAALTIGEAASLGAGALALVAVAVAATILGGALIARAAGLSSPFAFLSAGAVAICGASAAMAISAVLPQTRTSERDVIVTVAVVTTLSTLAMILYPSLAHAMGLSDADAGLLLGATIHDVAQVVGAGYIHSETAGEIAAIVKLVRVALLAPVVVLLALAFRGAGALGGSRRALPPLFVIGFFAAMLANSAGLLPAMLLAAMQEASRWCLVVAVAALGMKTSLKEVFAVGPRPLIALSLQTLLLLAIVAAGVALLR